MKSQFYFMDIAMMNTKNFKWTGKPQSYVLKENIVEIVTNPHTDLRQRTYYHFRNANAPVFQIETEEKYFSFAVKPTLKKSHRRFDQCGIVMYLDSENWLKASIEYENEEYQHLGSVVTNQGYSYWATTEIPTNVKSMWYRLSRREDDYCIECSEDGLKFKQMRICHMHNADEKIQFGIYACSPEDSSFKAVFSNMQLYDLFSPVVQSLHNEQLAEPITNPPVSFIFISFANSNIIMSCFIWNIRNSSSCINSSIFHFVCKTSAFLCVNTLSCIRFGVPQFGGHYNKPYFNFTRSSFSSIGSARMKRNNPVPMA